MPKRRKKRFLTVYTVSYGINYIKTGMTHIVTGSYLSRGDAIRECAKLVVEKLGLYPEIRTSFLDDKLHTINAELVRNKVPEEDIEAFFGNASLGKVCMPTIVEKAIMPYLCDVIGGESCYRVRKFKFGQDDGTSEMVFDIDESDVECVNGLQTWTCITSGTDSDGHDQEFEQPFPEIFFEEENAIECALDDLRQCLEGYDKHSKDDILDEARESLDENGYYEFDLNDSTSRRWDIWSTPIDIGQGASKIQRR